MQFDALAARLVSSPRAEWLEKRLRAALGAPPPIDIDERRRFFLSRNGNRYWWFRRTSDAYVPDCYRILNDAEWQVLKGWFEDTDARSLIGECSVPAISWLVSLASANDVGRIVQLGTYAGYSTLLLGWALKRMGKRHALLAVDLEPELCEYVRHWVTRAGLDDVVWVECCDSATSALAGRAESYLGGPPQVVFIDSSHQYRHTLQELDLWYAALEVSGMVVMHDTSEYAASFDSTGAGGVRRAFEEWRARTGVEAFDLSYPRQVLDTQSHVYMDGCGLGLVVKQSGAAIKAE